MTFADADTHSAESWRPGEWISSLINGLMLLLLAAVPASVIGHFLNWEAKLVFLCAVVGLIPLAKFMGQVTEEIAVLTGPSIGGLLNATFGNAAELIIAVIALRAGLVDVVKATVTGSIISNLLLVAGLAMFLGGVRYKQQVFQPVVARVNASSMNLAVVALLLPTVVAYTAPTLGELSIQELSVAVALVLLGVYGLTLLFSLKTHSYLYSIHEVEEEEAAAAETHEPNPVLEARGSIPQVLKAPQSKGVGIWVLALLGLASLVAVESELLVGSLEAVLEEFPITELFLGVILLPVIGNAAEHATAVTVAMKNKMDLSLSVAMGSTLQIALFVAPVLVLVGAALHQPMDFQFGLIELVAVGVSVWLANSVSSDGQSNWLEGLLLLATYVILAIAVFFIP
jgi:Ca2+:H+ antiporter